jgi:hypothetical protein
MTDQFRVFTLETCSKIVTYELKSEQDARNRQTSRARANGPNKGKEPRRDEGESSGRRQRNFNIQTYKFHALGDYVDTIKVFGTTDSFSTEVVGCDLVLPFQIITNRYQGRKGPLRSKSLVQAHKQEGLFYSDRTH